MSQTPLYLQIKHSLEEDIRSGRIERAGRFPTEKELTERFGVSRITVRKAFSELETDGVITRIPGKGTFFLKKDSEASPGISYSSTESVMIGVIMCHLDSYFQVSLLKSIEKTIGKMGHQMVFGLSNGKSKVENELIDRMLSSGVQGLIIYPIDGMFYNEKILRLSMDGFPVVLVDRYLPGINTCSVYSDDKLGGTLIGEYLTAKGHKNIACLTPPPQETICLLDRIEGFNNAVLEAGLVQNLNQGLNDITNYSVSNEREMYEHNVRRIRSFIDTAPEVTALFCTTATIAMSAYKAVLQSGREIEVASFDDITAYEWTIDYPISYVIHSEVQMGHEAVNSVLKLIQGEKVQNIVIPCNLVRYEDRLGLGPAGSGD